MIVMIVITFCHTLDFGFEFEKKTLIQIYIYIMLRCCCHGNIDGGGSDGDLE